MKFILKNVKKANTFWIIVLMTKITILNMLKWFIGAETCLKINFEFSSDASMETDWKQINTFRFTL